MCLKFSKNSYLLYGNNLKCLILVGLCISIAILCIILSFTTINIDELLIHKAEIFSKNEMKTILVWESCFGSVYCGIFSDQGTKSFSKINCSVNNCFITNNRNYLPVDQFDAIIFHGPNLINKHSDYFPTKRSMEQHYIYLSHETPINYPVTHSLDGFFNLTMTYRFDSDIPDFYFGVVNTIGINIAPANHPLWIQPDFSNENLNEFKTIYKSKSKKIAWIVSNCKSYNGRENYVGELRNFISVDIYGECGPFKCPRTTQNKCLEMLRKDYFFYLSFENANCVDYISEKAPKALNNGVIPILLGSANYSKYFPPHSYIDANNMSPKELATFLYSLSSNESRYIEYFWWRNYYEVKNVFTHACKLCEVLNSDLLHKSYDIVDWWAGTPNNSYCEPKKYE